MVIGLMENTSDCEIGGIGGKGRWKGRIEVIELVPPAVQTDLTPGQATREGYLPLADFIDEVMALFQQQPTPREILVQRVAFLRNAEAEHRFDHAVMSLNDAVR